MYSARVILDSVAPNGRRLTTMEWIYPRFIHAEFMTHRDRARNAASSRAIPFEKMLSCVEKDPVIPLAWQCEGGGMQGTGELPEALRPLALAIWMRARQDAARHAEALRNIERTAYQIVQDALDGAHDLAYEIDIPELQRWTATAQETHSEIKLHKTMPNRLVEPWMWITVLTTATEWKNLWRLRCHGDAEIHFQKIAYLAREAYEASTPRERTVHLPLVDEVDLSVLRDIYDVEDLMRISTARCARISYLTHEGKRDAAKDLDLFERLVHGSGFGHWSPHEHPAVSHNDANHRSGPYRGWMQFRKYFQLRECADE